MNASTPDSASLKLKQLLGENTMPAAEELTVHLDDGAIRCLACGHRCLVKPGRAGICRVRFQSEDGFRAPAGYVAGVQVDPIEKKPFYHAYPARNALSFGMLGCDLHCSYCQNWVTSQALRDDQAVSPPKFCQPGDLVRLARENEVPVVVSTYNEPLITAEWAVEVFRPAREAGLVCGFVSNGNATPEVLRYLRPFVDLYKVDLKSFQDRNYRELGGVLKNVLDSIARLCEMGFWVEIVTLVVPGFNDSDDELRDMATFLAGVSPDIPWHLTAFHPQYKMTDPPRTPTDTLLRGYDIGRQVGLKFVYPGNCTGQVGDRESTHCPQCDKVLIRRRGFLVEDNGLTAEGQCPDCSTAIPGVWEANPPKKTSGFGIPLPVHP